jgi:hypothetical protein
MNDATTHCIRGVGKVRGREEREKGGGRTKRETTATAGKLHTGGQVAPLFFSSLRLSMRVRGAVLGVEGDVDEDSVAVPAGQGHEAVLVDRHPMPQGAAPIPESI